MPSFEYEAITAEGQRISSVAFGRNLQEVILSLTQQGLEISRIQDAYSKQDPLIKEDPVSPSQMPLADPLLKPEEVRREQPSEVVAEPVRVGSPVEMPDLSRRNPVLTNIVGPIVKVPGKDLAFFFRQLGTMMEAGVPMVQTLDTLGRQCRDIRLRKVVNEMRRAAEAGLPFSAVMQRYPEMFSPLVISLIRAGEEGGFLAGTCKQVSEYMDHEIELRNLYRRETFMPKLYLVMSMLIIGATNLVFSSLGLKGGLNAPLNEADTWYVLGPAIIGLFLFFRVGLSFYPLRRGWDGIILKIPYLGKTVHQFAMAKFGRAFGALYRGGVPITKSIHLSADATGNEWLRARIYPAVRKLEDGEPISQTLAATAAFSPIVLNMMSTGETTGSLDQMLLRVAEYYEDEAKVRARQTANVTGVLVGLAVAIYIGFIVISFWMGYMGNMMQQINST